MTKTDNLKIPMEGRLRYRVKRWSVSSYVEVKDNLEVIEPVVH